MKNKKVKLITGEVIKKAGLKTCIVAVTKFKVQPIYQKKLNQFKKYLVHDEKDQYKAGDKVLITEIRPKSKRKSWQIVKKV